MAQDPRALIQKADKTVASASGGFSFFGGREDKYQEAVDLYIQAANAFRLQNQNREAGQTFEKAASIQTRNLKEPDDAANTMIEAFKVYRKDQPEDAVRCLNVAINQYCLKGNFRRAATYKENEGELFETQIGDLKRAAEAYETAAQWYENDNAQALASKLWLKTADIAALNGDYRKAIDLFEKVGAESVNNRLMRYSVKEYFLKAGICHLAAKDMVATERALEKYLELDPAFAREREYQLLVDLSAAVKAGDQQTFTDRLFDYDRLSRLDKWKTTMCVRIKDAIEGGVEGDEDDFA